MSLTRIRRPPAQTQREGATRREYSAFEPWFPIPHYFLDDLAPILPGPHFKVLIFLFRKIVGWHKESDLISLSQIQHEAGVSRKIAVDSLRIFQDAGIIGKRRGMGLRGVSRIYIIYKADSAQVTSFLRELVKKGKKGRLRVTHETRTGPQSELSLVSRVNTQKEQFQRKGKEGAGAPSHYAIPQDPETEAAKSEFFREWARIAGKKTIG